MTRVWRCKPHNYHGAIKERRHQTSIEQSFTMLLGVKFSLGNLRGFLGPTVGPNVHGTIGHGHVTPHLRTPSRGAGKVESSGQDLLNHSISRKLMS